ncbi:MAG: hypothetical protein NZM04_04795 [Methylacidiphilales bacterium]|nr:hypothetical protein [Candidatus Methylacidiphilales bacterium]MDW8349728.1 hypothetical protein [Verrucomicrobiae bacterium]
MSVRGAVVRCCILLVALCAGLCHAQGSESRRVAGPEPSVNGAETLSNLGSFRARYEQAGRPKIVGLVVPYYDELWGGKFIGEGEEREVYFKADAQEDGVGLDGGRLTEEQIRVIEEAFELVFKNAGVEIVFVSFSKIQSTGRSWPSRDLLYPRYGEGNRWRELGDMIIEIGAAFRKETPSRWEVVALLYDVRRNGVLVFSVNSNEILGFTNRQPPRRVEGVTNLRTVCRRAASYLIQGVKLPAFDYLY